jgi:hypothetical protein
MEKRGPGRLPGYQHPESVRAKLRAEWAERKRFEAIGRAVEAAIASVERAENKEGQ